MAVTSNRSIVLTLGGDLAANLQFDSAENADAPGVSEVLILASGVNTITLPTGGTVVTGATIIPPDDNEETITLKGVTGDTGISISMTEPTSIAFDTGQPVSFVLTTSGIITGLRIIWT